MKRVIKTIIIEKIFDKNKSSEMIFKNFISSLDFCIFADNNIDMNHFYIHIPFCRKKCNYCAFYSIKYDETSAKKFLDSLLKEISTVGSRFFDKSREDKSKLDTVHAKTIFFGGGTPSILDANDISKIISAIEKNFGVEKFDEATIECNPESIFLKKLLIYRKSGINRISIGIQSLGEKFLKFLGRIHTKEDALSSIDTAFESGFDNVSADLIFGIPEQTKEDILRDIDEVISRGVKHISLYSLTLEKNTPLEKMIIAGEVKLPSSDELAEIYYAAAEFFKKAGFRNYEVSNFALPEYECLHNLAYWLGDYYLGFGPAAHSFYEDKRWHNINSLEEYVERLTNGALPSTDCETIGYKEKFEEFIMIRLRLADGFSIKEAAEILNIKIDDFKTILKNLIDNNILVESGEKILLSQDRRLLADGVAEKIVRDTFSFLGID